MSLDDQRTFPLSPTKGGSEKQNGRFSSKIALRLKKVCYKVSLNENCQQQSCKALCVQKRLVGATLIPEILDQTDRVGAKSLIFHLVSFVATQL